MRNKPSQASVIYFIIVIVSSFDFGITANGEDAEPRSAGPDVITGGVAVSGIAGDYVYWGSSGDISAYSVATTSCNVGTQDMPVQQATSHHNAISTNLFRLSDGRFEQIGQSWLFHNFCALSEFFCGDCPTAGSCATLKPACSDPHTANRMGNAQLGPRWQVNASTGVFTFPPQSPDPDTPAVIRRRLQVYTNDIIPSLNSDALYFLECQNVSPEDSAAGNDDNNASRRRVAFNASLQMSFPESTVQEEPAIFAWPTHEPGVLLKKITVINDGRFWIGYKATEVTPGVLWHYEYAIHNLNSHRSGQSFSVPLPQGASITNIGFHDVDYHSGEPVIGTDWSDNGGVGGILTWSCDAYTPANEVTANALRWGTLYNFRFEANAPPQDVTATLGLFRPGQPGDPSAMNVDMFVGNLAVSNCADMTSPNGGALDSADTVAFVDRLMQEAACP